MGLGRQLLTPLLIFADSREVALRSSVRDQDLWDQHHMETISKSVSVCFLSHESHHETIRQTLLSLVLTLLTGE